jgi:hypothetical protein
MTPQPATRPYAPSHTTSGGGIDPTTECTCQRPYVTMAGPCPCPCHDVPRLLPPCAIRGPHSRDAHKAHCRPAIDAAWSARR